MVELGALSAGTPGIASIPGVRTDAELIQAVLRSEAGADEEWVSRHRRLVIGLARSRYGLDVEQAEEILQKTVATLWAEDRKALRAWRGEGRFSTYLSVIVCRLCRETRSRDLRRRTHEAPPASTEPIDRALSPHEGAAARERQRQVEVALSELRPRDRLLIALRFLDDRQPTEMAPILGLSPGAVRKGVHDALGRLRRRLEEPGTAGTAGTHLTGGG